MIHLKSGDSCCSIDRNSAWKTGHCEDFCLEQKADFLFLFSIALLLFCTYTQNVVLCLTDELGTKILQQGI